MNKAVNFSIIFLGIVSIGFLLKEFQSFLRPFAIAVILTLAIIPVMRRLKSYGIPNWLTIVGIIVLFVVLLYIVISLITNESIKLSQNLPAYETQIKSYTEAFLANELLEDFNFESLYNPDSVRNFVKTLLQGILSLGSELFIALIFTIFLIPSHKRLTEGIEKDLSALKKRKFRSVLDDVEKSIRDYLYAKSIISLGTAFVSLFILYLFGADFLVLTAVLIFIFNFIPNIGSIVAVVFAEILYVLKFGLGFGAVWLLILLTLVQILFGNIIEPKFAGHKLKLSPIVILLSLFVWYYIWGIIGMILAIPLTSILKIILEHIRKTKKIGEFLSQ